MRTCTRCGIERPASDFHKWSGYKDGYRPDCKMCRREYGRQRQKRLKHELTARRYGTSTRCYLEILEIQGGRCAICLAAPVEGARSMPIDHDHVTGRLRGILCPRCNGGLGMFQDSPALLRKAADYLEFWSRGWELWGKGGKTDDE